MGKEDGRNSRDTGLWRRLKVSKESLPKASLEVFASLTGITVVTATLLSQLAQSPETFLAGFSMIVGGEILGHTLISFFPRSRKNDDEAEKVAKEILNQLEKKGVFNNLSSSEISNLINEWNARNEEQLTKILHIISRSDLHAKSGIQDLIAINRDIPETSNTNQEELRRKLYGIQAGLLDIKMDVADVKVRVDQANEKLNRVDKKTDELLYGQQELKDVLEGELVPKLEEQEKVREIVENVYRLLEKSLRSKESTIYSELREHEINILFAIFSDPIQISNPGIRWPTVLKEALSEILSSENVGLHQLTTIISNETEARAYLEESKADGVVWGEVDDDYVKVNYSWKNENYLLPSSYFLMTNGENNERVRLHIKNCGNIEYLIYLLLAISYHKKGEGDRALELLRNAINTCPVEEQEKYELDRLFLFGASIYSEAEDNEKALGLVSGAIKINPTNSDAWTQCAQYLSKMGYFDEAEFALDKAIDLAPESISVLVVGAQIHFLSGKYDQALQDYGKLLDSTEDLEHLAIALNNRGFISFNQGQIESAKSDYINSISLNPNNPQPYNNLANLFAEVGNKAEALSNYEIAIILDPNNAMILGNRGLLYYEMGDLENARIDLERSIEIKPSAEVFNSLGMIYGDLGDYRKADEYFELAINHDSALPNIFNNRGYYKAKRGDYLGAMDDYNSAIRLNPNYADAYLNLLSSLLKTDQLFLAYSTLKKYLSISNNTDGDLLSLLVQLEAKVNSI